MQVGVGQSGLQVAMPTAGLSPSIASSTTTS